MILKTTNLTCLYQDGNIRYVKMGDIEIIRLIYTALRDANWLTAEMQIVDETVEQNDNQFKIRYKAHYQLNDIDYQATVNIIGTPDDQISFAFEGEAQSDFLKNRIGICVHQPIHTCAGRLVQIEDEAQNVQTAVFPQFISPQQPFLNVQIMTWQTDAATETSLTFEGDIFETEDQRNWTDNSYKTYSTPLHLPFPVAVKKGDKVKQQVLLQIAERADLPVNQQSKINNLQSAISNQSLLIKHLFPKIGYARSASPLTQTQIDLLKQVPFDHYRVACFFEENWQNELKNAVLEAKSLQTTIELVLLLNEKTERNWADLQAILEKNAIFQTCLLIGQNGTVAPQEWLAILLPKLKETLPTAKIGAGTDAFFADLNRNRPTDARLDFVSFSINPQVHLADTQTLIENLEAQKYTIETARSFSEKPIHVSPVTFKPRLAYINGADVRQHTDFGASWTALSIKYLAGAASITFYETVGEKGILNPDGNLPVFELLRKIKEFQPKYIIQNAVENPLSQDELQLENAEGKQWKLRVDFEQ